MFRPVSGADEKTVLWKPVARAIQNRIRRKPIINFDHHPSYITDVPTCESITPATRFFQVSPRVRLRVAQIQAIGDVKGTVVFVLGKGGTIEDYQKIANSYARDGYETFVYDPRGQGYSTRMDPDMNKVHVNSPKEHMNDLKKLLKEHIVPKQKGPLLLVGHSMGAAVILAGLGKKMFYADKLILLAPMIRALRAPDGVRGYGAQVLSAAHKLTFRGRRYMGKHRPNGIGVSAGWVHSYYIFRKMLRDMKPINIPTLLILAEKDEGISGTDAIKFCQKKIEGFLDTSIHILAGADHNFDQGFARIPDSAKTTAHFMREQIVSLTNAI